MSTSTVLITGASSGIGRALAHLFARDGYSLVLVARRAEALDEVAAELNRAHNAAARVVPADLARIEGGQQLFDELQRAGVTVDVLVNNAGFGLQGEFVKLPLERQVEMINLNATSLTVLTRLFLPGMIERRRGGVLNVASTAAFQPGPLMAVYYATKAYVLSLSEAVGDEVSGTGVRVTCLAPGPTETAFAAAAGITDARLFKGPTMTVDEVARIGYEGWQRGQSLVVPGARNRFGVLLARVAPRAFMRKVVRGLNTRTA